MWWPAAAWGAPSGRAASTATSTLPLPRVATTPAHLSVAPPTPAPKWKFLDPTLQQRLLSSNSAASATEPQGATLPHSTVTHQYPAGTPYQDGIIGGNPQVAGAGTTTITVPIIPLKFVDTNGTVSDASTVPADGCNSAGLSPAALTAASPLFSNQTPDPVTPATQTQLLDAYMRGNFYQDTKTGGISPNYHLSFNPVLTGPETVTVPTADIKQNTVNTTKCTTGHATQTEVDDGWFTTNFPALVNGLIQARTISPNQMPLFVMYNSVLCSSVADNCASGGAAGGYHSFLNTSINICRPPTCLSEPVTEVYGVYNVDLTGLSFGPDTSILAHEVAEAVNDPWTNNAVPAWGDIGQVQGCQYNLEVGDPLSPGGILSPNLVSYPYTVNGNAYTFHVQDLAYHSWFFREASPPSSAQVANKLGSGEYSMFGDFTTGSDSTVCVGVPTGVTAVPGGSSATVSWTAAPGPVTGYSVQAYQNGNPVGGASTTAAANQTSATIKTTLLVDGQTYTFIVFAQDSANNDYASSPSNPVTIGTPTAPTNVTASAITNGAMVSWTSPSYPIGDPPGSYVITPFLNGVAEAPETFTGFSFTTTEKITGLTAGQHYTFTVAATNGFGTGPTSGQSNSVVPTAPK
jgi:hypothetical protein